MKRNRPLNEEKGKAILHAAVQEFHTKGYEGTSMDTIAKSANVSKATVYKHFKNKEELFFAIAYILKERMDTSYSYTYNDKPIALQLKEMAQNEMDFLCHKENVVLLHIITVALMQKSNVAQKLLKAVEKEQDKLASIIKWFEIAKSKRKLDFEDSSFVAKQFVGHIKAFAFYPQFYGTPILSNKEQLYIVKKTVQMVIELYTPNA